MGHHTRLSVNVDHVATLRQARGVDYPSPTEAARLAEDAGAAGITIHLRQDRRHIQDSDLFALVEQVRGKLNLEMSTRDEMLEIALRARPQQVTLVPERADEVTTEGGLDLVSQADHVRHAAEALAIAGISVSLFLDPDPRQIDRLSELGSELTPGFEINTDAYSRGSEQSAAQLELVRAAARHGAERGFQVFAGHGLTVANVAAISGLPEVEELNIGHAIVSRAVLIGMSETVEEFLTAMAVNGEQPEEAR